MGNKQRNNGKIGWILIVAAAVSGVFLLIQGVYMWSAFNEWLTPATTLSREWDGPFIITFFFSLIAPATVAWKLFTRRRAVRPAAGSEVSI